MSDINKVFQNISINRERKIIDEFSKGKKANVGEIREWGGKKYQKTVNGWVPYNEGGKKSKQDDKKPQGKKTDGKQTQRKEADIEQAKSKFVRAKTGYMRAKSEKDEAGMKKYAKVLQEQYEKLSEAGIQKKTDKPFWKEHFNGKDSADKKETKKIELTPETKKKILDGISDATGRNSMRKMFDNKDYSFEINNEGRLEVKHKEGHTSFLGDGSIAKNLGSENTNKENDFQNLINTASQLNLDDAVNVTSDLQRNIITATEAVQKLLEIGTEYSKKNKDKAANLIRDIMDKIIDNSLSIKKSETIKPITAVQNELFIHDDIAKAYNIELSKGRAFPIGTVRDWNGEKWKKVINGWVRVSDGKHAHAKGDKEVTPDDANVAARNKNMYAYMDQLGLGLNNDGKTMFYPTRVAYKTDEEFTRHIKHILDQKMPSEKRVKELFKAGLKVHEIVNVTGTPLSATLDYLKKGLRKGEIYSTSVDVTSHFTQKEKTDAQDKNIKEPELKTDELKIPKLSVKERFDSYKLFATQVGLGISKSLFVYGSGGVGKTYTLLDKKDGVFPRLKLRKGDLAGEIPLENQENVGHSEESIVGIDPQTGHKFLKKDKYDYIVSTGRITATRLFAMMQEHNGKILVFDDSDEILLDGNAANILKGATDTSGDGTISWNTTGNISTEFSNIKGAKPVTDSKGKVIRFDLPKTFKFNGQIVFISNFKADKVPQALLSRADKLDLTMTRKEVLDQIDNIKYLVKTYDTQGNIFKTTKESRDLAFNFMKKYIDKFDEADLNVRTFNKLAKNFQVALDLGHTKEYAEKAAIASYLLKTNYKGK